MNRIYLLTILCLFLFLPMSAQTFYEVNYTDPDDDDEYIGLMIYYDDQHCKVRFINEEMLNNNDVAESNYVQVIEGKEGKDDVGIMVYAPEKKDFPILVWLWEEDDASDINEKPYCTFNPDDPETYFEVTHFEEITLNDMDQEYVEQFFGEDEEEYKMLMNGIRQVKENGNSEIILNTPEVTKPTFHLLLVANTEVSDIGVACQRDLNNLKGEFSAIAKVLGMDYDEQVVAASSYNKANVVKMVRGMKANPNDVLMFVYTGHGFRFDNQKDYFPNIDLRSSNYDDIKKSYIAMTDIYDELVKKGARLNIILSDCCNTKAGLDAPMTNVNSLFSRSNTNFDINKLQTLFLGSRGNIKATASSPGEMSWCGQNGGFFILSFLESLRSQISPLQQAAPSWDNLVSNAMTLAKSKSTSSSSTKAQNGIKLVETKLVKFDPTIRANESNEDNVAPGEGGNTLDL